MKLMQVFSAIFICAFIRIANSNTVSLDREDRRSNCGSLEFRCRNGDCIESNLLCDGRADCGDGSDETREECMRSEIVCPEYAFRCKYGACVDGDATCNGIDDCVDRSDELLPECRNYGTTDSSMSGGCSSSEFRCNDGQCVPNDAICDGATNCTDLSDETAALCDIINCPTFTFRCKYGACIDNNLKCNGARNCADGSDEDPNLCVVEPVSQDPTKTPALQSPSRTRPLCTIPSQPANGRWRLHKSQCQSGRNCDPRANTRELDPGTYLIYTCNEGYKLNGSGDVFCGPGGKWSNKPQCDQIQCKKLRTASTEADCRRNGDWISCDAPVPPGTVARVSCRNSYRQESTILSAQRENVRCNARGLWEPEPIRCTPGPITVNIYFNGTILSLQNDSDCPVTRLVELVNNKNIIFTDGQVRGNDYPEIDVRMVCGRTIPKDTAKPLIVNGKLPKISDFPWHATLYKSDTPDGYKKFICGATIIQSDLLITAAHCVYDEATGKIEDADTFAIVTGNIFQEYNSSLHHPTAVKKAKVKRIYVVCNYLGLRGKYARDIAIIKIERAFTFSSILMPACLDTSIYSDQYVLELGNRGKVAGFGRTALANSSQVLQTIEVPYIPLNECKLSSPSPDDEEFITIDKFCAGYRNGTSVCDGDSGGGLVFQTGGLWYLRGIVSVGMGATFSGGIKSCDSHAYALYTKISSHIEWIQDVMLKLEIFDTLPSSCPDNSRNRENVN